MGVAGGARVTKLYPFHKVPPILRLSEYGDLIKTQTVRIVPSKYFSKLGPCY